MSRAPVVGAVTDLQPGRAIRVDQQAVMAAIVRGPGPMEEIPLRVERTAAVRHLLVGGDALPPANVLQSLVARLAPRTGHTLVRVAFAHDRSGGDPDLRWTCECHRSGWGWTEARQHYLRTSEADVWRTRPPLRIRREHPTGVHGLSATLQDHPDGSTTRMVVLCDCGWYVVGTPGQAVQAAAWALAHRTVADRDPRPEVRWRDEHQTLTRLAILSLEEHELRDLPRTVSETLVLESGVLVDEIRANPGLFATPGAHPDDLTHHSSLIARPAGWRDVGCTTDGSSMLGLTAEPIPGDENYAFLSGRRQLRDGRVVSVSRHADEPVSHSVWADRTPPSELADLDRFENTAAGIRAALERIDAEDRAGRIGVHQSTDGARWIPDDPPPPPD